MATNGNLRTAAAAAAVALSIALSAEAQDVEALQLPPALLDLHGATSDCDALEDMDYIERRRIVLEEGVELWLLPCFAGAYNISYAAYRNLGEAEYERALFVTYSDYTSWSSTGVLVNPEWNADTATLSTYDLGRGIGDCGSRGEWHYADDMLRLERFFHKSDCDGEGEPGEFPLVYEAKPFR